MRFVAAKNRAEAVSKIGRDWYKLVKVEGGYAAFETRAAYETWKAQK